MVIGKSSCQLKGLPFVDELYKNVGRSVLGAVSGKSHHSAVGREGGLGFVTFEARNGNGGREFRWFVTTSESGSQSYP